MVARFAAFLHGAIGAMRRRDVGFVADDGIDAVGGAFLVKLDRAEEIAVIGHGDRVHAERLGQLHQLRHAARAVEQAVMRVAMEMNKRSIGHDARSFKRWIEIPLLLQKPRRGQMGNSRTSRCTCRRIFLFLEHRLLHNFLRHNGSA